MSKKMSDLEKIKMIVFLPLLFAIAALFYGWLILSLIWQWNPWVIILGIAAIIYAHNRKKAGKKIIDLNELNEFIKKTIKKIKASEFYKKKH